MVTTVGLLMLTFLVFFSKATDTWLFYAVVEAFMRLVPSLPITWRTWESV